MSAAEQLAAPVAGTVGLPFAANEGVSEGPGERAWDRIYALPAVDDDVVGGVEQRMLRHEHTFAKVAREEGVGFDALQHLNPGVDAWLPGEGTRVLLPTAFVLPQAPREGIVVNLSERRLYYYDRDRGRLLAYPIGIGTDRARTPIGTTRTVARIQNPTWTPPESVRLERLQRGEELPSVVPPGPDNPLGGYAIKLGLPGIFIHGTNSPIGVGRRVSHGCIRLYEKHIAVLATSVPNGTPVNFVRQPYKVGWRAGTLYLESHHDARTDTRQDFSRAVGRVIAATQDTHADVDWDLVMQVARAHRGIPEPISR